MFIIYDLILVVLIALYLPYMTVRRKWHKGLWFRLGRIPRSTELLFKQKANIWVHAISVGEILAVSDLIRRLQALYPGHQIVCSTVTQTGYKVARQKLSEENIVIFAPLDLSWVVRKFVRLIQPKIYISAETEIWPNLYATLHKQKAPILVINGRISDTSLRGYKKIKFFLKGILDKVDKFLMQGEEDARRIIALGAPKESVRVTGNLKFDNLPQATRISRKDYGFAEDDKVFIAGSTHPGEEEIVLRAHRRLLEDHPELRLVIAPRHIERCEKIKQLIAEEGFQPVLFSGIQKAKITQNTVILVDTIGQLRLLYAIAKVVFVGKSLCVGGGQNIIEPAFFGKPILIGPLTYNFKDVVAIFRKEEAVIVVEDGEQLYEQLKNLLTDESLCDALSEAASQIVRRYQGATSKTLKVIGSCLES